LAGGQAGRARVMAMISFLVEFWQFIRVRKKYWLIPVLIMLAIVGAIVLTQGSALGPFMYALF